MADGKKYETFSAAVDPIVSATKLRLRVLIQMSTQDLIIDAQKPVAKGGRMRVDTGFLRASGRISFNGMPSGPTRPPDDAEENSFKAAEVWTAQLAGADVGVSIFFGWTANYAKYREAYDGFLGGAVQKWQQIVTANGEKIKGRIK